jgi:hypothetical protein
MKEGEKEVETRTKNKKVSRVLPEGKEAKNVRH